MDALASAKMYFTSAKAKSFSKSAQAVHFRKLNELIEACEIMQYHSENNMGIFKQIITGSQSFDVGAIKAQQLDQTRAEKERIEREEQAQYERDVKKLEARLEAKKAQMGGLQLIDLRALKDGIVRGPQFLI
jgi:biopolymer transport protein ExbB/TolQ